jgi:hypothetical protein
MAVEVSAKQVAEWMMEQLRPDDARLFQPDTVDHILQAYGPEFLRRTGGGSWAMSESVLREFRKLHRGSVVYSHLHRFWEKLD